MNSHFQKLISNKIFKDPTTGLSLPFSTIELTRDFIKDSLYNEDYDYFSKKNIILPVKEPIPFRNLLNRSSYLGEQRKRYDNAVTKYRWHTPSEIFNPTYAKIVFEWIISHHHHRNRKHHHHRKNDFEPLVIYEIGGGNGTLKNGIIERSKELKIPIGEYNIIDISTHSPSVIKRDFLDSNSLGRERRNCFVLGMEVLDNLPQDKIRWHNDVLEESYVITGVNGGPFLEIFLPSEDPLIKECVLAIMDDPKHYWKSLQRTKFKDYLLAYLPDSIKSVIDEHPFSIGCSSQLRETFPHHSEFIPTGPFKFLKNLKQQFPFSNVLLSDFHYLPRHNSNYDDDSNNSVISSSIFNSSTINGPLVQGWMDGEQVECSSHLLKKGEFDIFFPINFDLLSHFWSQINIAEETSKETKTEIWSHREFIEEFGNGIEQECQTRSGYNPLKEEFSNASFIALNGELK